MEGLDSKWRKRKINKITTSASVSVQPSPEYVLNNPSEAAI